MKIIVDGDACPKIVKELLYRTAERRAIALLFVANKRLYTPPSPLITQVVVAQGADEADDHIVTVTSAGDLVITADIPLADRAIKCGAVVLDPRGVLITAETIGQRLAMRNLMDELRQGGLETGGPSAYGPKERQAFANQLDRLLTKMSVA